MKLKHFLFAASFAAVLLAGCKKDEEVTPTPPPPPGPEGMTFTVTIQPFKDANTKTSLLSDGKVAWNSNDSISINGVPFKVYSLSEDSTSAVFIKSGTAADPTAPFTAYYPYSLVNNASATPELPMVQNWNKEGDLSDVNPMYAESAKEQVLEFTSLCGLVEIQVSGAGNLSAIKLHAGNGSFSGPFSLATDLTGYSAVVEDGDPLVMLNMGYDGVKLSDKAQSFCVALPAGCYSDVSVQFLGSDGKNKTVFLDKGITVQKGMREIVKEKVTFSFSSADEAFSSLDACYAMINGSEYCPNWALGSATLIGNGPAMDIQFTGADAAFNTQSVTAGNEFLGNAWFHCYKAINLCNGFISVIENTESSEKITQAQINELKGEAYALRGFFYSWLAQTFGSVSIIDDTVFTDNTHKEKASYADLWNHIIEDFRKAAELLEWYPYNGEYGRVTKGMALAYLGDAYMWKAYRVPETNENYYQKAYEVFAQVINSNIYSLAPLFSSQWDPEGIWENSGEMIWATCFDPYGFGHQLYAPNHYSGYYFINDITECVAYPSRINPSWEWYDSFEDGSGGSYDKRRDASCCTDSVVLDEEMQKYGIKVSKAVWGINPFVDYKMAGKYFHNADNSPAICCTKFWRTATIENGRMTTVPFIWKRYANVMLDYAECCFKLDKVPDGWAYINQIRERAFGNQEARDNNFSKYSTYYRTLPRETPIEGDYVLPINTEIVTVPDATSYYTAVKADKKFSESTPVWQVAVNMERRKEFMGEASLSPDMIRSGFMEDYLNTIYSIKKDVPTGEAYYKYPWTKRDFTFDANKLVMPIPQYELDHNPLMKQNPGY